MMTPMIFLCIPELVWVGLRQTSFSPEFHIVISGSSVVYSIGLSSGFAQ